MKQRVVLAFALALPGFLAAAQLADAGANGNGLQRQDLGARVQSVLWSESFENGAVGANAAGWVDHWSSGGVRIENTLVSGGQQGALVQGNGGNCRGASYPGSLFEQDVLIQFDVYLPTNYANSAPTLFGYAGISHYFYCEGSTYSYTHNGEQLLSGITPLSWHHISMRVDWDDAVFSIALDQEPYSAWVAFTPNVSGGWGSDFSLYGQHQQGSPPNNYGYYDEISISAANWDEDVAEADEQPAAFSLLKAYPNPFNPTTMLAFELPETAEVRLAIYDLAGREVAVLADGLVEHGRREFQWQAGNAASGIYLAVLRHEAGCETQRLLLLK